MKNLVGPSFEELTSKEMKEIQGAGDVKAETTPATLVELAGASSVACARTATYIITGAGLGAGAVYSAKHC
ncbi:lichenicidin A2 family type 2 lantibiotic (plasmid) [Priestia megaterium]|uniref:lichenicidin A2 family type 2 lantibiotic n=1 Tax=Priestia megaterium TaxID=1404 RepID=UPI003CFF9D4F